MSPSPVAPAKKAVSLPVSPPAEKEKHDDAIAQAEPRRQSSEPGQIPPIVRSDGSRVHSSGSGKAKLNEDTLSKRQKKLLAKVTTNFAKKPSKTQTMSSVADKTTAQPEKRKQDRPARKTAP